VENKIISYKDLRIWQKSMEIVTAIYKLTKLFPKEEIYGLTSQMRRSAVSISSNIAEGFARQHNKEYKQFLYVSFGSCAELDTQLNIVKRLEYIPESQVEPVINDLAYLSRMIMSLIKKIK
jgi:four helix bundle protein